MADKKPSNQQEESTSTAKAKSGRKKLSLPEKVLSYPARVAILGGNALETAADQAAYNSGLFDKANPRFKESSRKGTGYSEAKKLGRAAIGLDSIDEPEGKKRGGKIKAYAKGGSVGSASKRADGCAQRGKTKGKMV